MNIKAHREHKEREHFFNAAKVVAGITLLSRIFGFFRDLAITSLGATRYNDAYGLAFQIPNLFRRLFGEGALASAFVPVFTEVHEKEGLQKSRLLLANAMAILAVYLATLLVIGEALFFLYSLVPGPKDRSFLMLLAMIMFPYMFTVCLLALCSAALNARGRFVFPAAAPIIFNIIGIIAAWWLAPMVKQSIPEQLVIVAVSIVFAGVVQLLAVLWLLKAIGLYHRPRLFPIEPGIRQIIKLVTPMTIGLGFLQLTELLQTVIAWSLTATKHSAVFHLFGWAIACPLTEGVIVRLNAARAFYQFPMGVLAISLGVAVYPLLSRYASRGDIPNLRSSINRAIRISMLEGLATGVGLFILAEPIMMIYAQRKFTVADAMQAAFVLKMYVLGMWAYCSYQILIRAFYASKDAKTPLIVSCTLAVVNLVLLLVFIWFIGPGAFGLSTSLTFAANVIILIYILRRRFGLLGGRKIAASFLRAGAACIAMTEIVYFFKCYMAGMNNLIMLAVCISAGAAMFIFILWLLNAPEIGEFLGEMTPVKSYQPEDI